MKKCVKEIGKGLDICSFYMFGRCELLNVIIENQISVCKGDEMTPKNKKRNTYFGIGEDSECLNFTYEELINHVVGNFLISIGEGKFGDAFYTESGIIAGWALKNTGMWITSYNRQSDHISLKWNEFYAKEKGTFISDLARGTIRSVVEFSAERIMAWAYFNDKGS